MRHQQQKTQLPSLSPSCTPFLEETNFAKNYHDLQAGINRIRYIKKKQQRNHNMMTDHLANMLKQLQRQQENNISNSSLPKAKSQPLLNKIVRYKMEEHSPYKQKLKKGSLIPRASHNGKCLFTYLSDKENCPRPKHHRDSGGSNFQNFDEQKPQSKNEKKRILLKKKQQNYQEMRELRNKRQQRQKQVYQEKLNAVRERKAKAIVCRQQGRKHIEDSYYHHINLIRADKAVEKEKKEMMNQKRYYELLEVQKQEEEELAQFEKSIILEEELKDLLERTSNKGAGSRSALITEDTFL